MDGRKSVKGDEQNGTPYDDETTRFVRPVLMGIVVLELVLMGLWGLQRACGPEPVMVEPSPSSEKQPWQFWKRQKEPVEVVEEAEPSSLFCQSVWATVEHVPLFAPKKNVKEDLECLQEETTKPNVWKRISSRMKKRKTTKTKPKSVPKVPPTAFSKPVVLTRSQDALVKKLHHQFKHEINLGDERASHVHWGGPGGPRWLTPTLLGSYLKIMKWPEDLITTFPFKLCSKTTCPSDFAIHHSLQWRESYKPWLISPAAIKENKNGFFYMRGHCKSPSNNGEGHALVWWRAGVKGESVKDATAYFRVVLHSLDLAVADSLQRSHGKVGKFNAVIDAAHVSYHVLPSLGDAKKAIVMLQDHFPDRLGMVLLANLSKISEILLSMVKPLLTREVRDKIVVLPSDPVKRQAMLEAVMEPGFIPDFLGGTDTYRFDPNEYYRLKKLQCTDMEAIEYQKAMPYHA